MSKSKSSSEYTIFRDLLRDFRTQKGITQVQLSESLGMPQSFVSKYETGERRLDFVEVRAVCLALGINVQTFTKKYEAQLGDLTKGGAS